MCNNKHIYVKSMLERTFEPSLPKKADEKSSPDLHAHSPGSTQPRGHAATRPPLSSLITESDAPACVCMCH